MDPEHEDRIGLSSPSGIAPADGDVRVEGRLRIGSRQQTIPLDGSVDEKLDLFITLDFWGIRLVPG